MKVGLITAAGSLTDDPYNWMSYQGLLRAEADLGVDGTVYTAVVSEDYASNLEQCVTDGNVLCISVGFTTSDAISNAAVAHPGTKFAIVDVSYPSYPSNLRGITFNVNQAAYLAGILAGSMSESQIVGAIGGMEIPPVTAYTLPFRNGVQCASPGATVLLAYTGDFDNPPHGAQVAEEFMSQGADVIFSPAGATGIGAVLATTQAGKWGIGVDTDAYYSVFGGGTVEGSDKLLTSALKKLDSGVYHTVQDVVGGTFTPGDVLYGLADEGTGLAPYHETEPEIPAAVRARLERVRQGILAGRIDVNGTECRNYLYLPLITR